MWLQHQHYIDMILERRTVRHKTKRQNLLSAFYFVYFSLAVWVHTCHFSATFTLLQTISSLDWIAKEIVFFIVLSSLFILFSQLFVLFTVAFFCTLIKKNAFLLSDSPSFLLKKRR